MINASVTALSGKDTHLKMKRVDEITNLMNKRILETDYVKHSQLPKVSHSIKGIVLYKLANLCFDLELFSRSELLFRQTLEVFNLLSDERDKIKYFNLI